MLVVECVTRFFEYLKAEADWHGRHRSRATTAVASASPRTLQTHKIPCEDGSLPSARPPSPPLSTTTLDPDSAPHAAHFSSTTMLRFLFHPTRPPDSSWGWSPPNLSANPPIQPSPRRNRSLLFRALPSSSRSPCRCRDTVRPTWR